MSESEPKWACEYCTYENYPSSLKCTMCRGPKPFISEDIYRLHGDKINVDENFSSTIGSAAGPLENKSKCPKRPTEYCTYINSSNICIYCGSTPVSANTLHEHIQPLKISQHSDLAQSLSQPRNNSPPASLTNLENSRRTSQAKWICSMCTYENWPKSVKCAMCGSSNGSQRSQAASLIMPSPDRIPESDINQDDRYKDYILDTSQGQNNHENERKMRRLKRNADWNWLNACIGVIEGDPNPVEAYLSSGGDPARTLTASEVAILNRSSAFDVGHTLVHLAIRFQREDLLAVLLSQIEGSGSGVKRVPSYVAPDIAADIRRHFSSTIRQRKGNFPCNFVTEFPTFTLPAEVDELPAPVQDQLFAELLDKDAQEQLENDPAVINWSLDITVRLGSRLYALWNRSAGDCLLDSVMQATWGVFDRDNMLRRALAESLGQGGHIFYPRWKEYESSHASFLQYSLEEGQWEEDWTSLISLASQPGTSLEQLHVFALAHILRRPIIVYGVKYVKSFRGEAIGYARFEGVYLPLLWDQSFCIRTPIALGYTRGHFSALVPIEPYSRIDSRPPVQHGNNMSPDHLRSTFLPLMDRDRKLLPIHFLMESELGREETILRQWLDVCETEGGILVAQQLLHKRPLLVAQMVEEWLNHYRRLSQMTSAPFVRPIPIQDYSSEGDTDDE
ncbi:ubiquitin thioesterase trabid isoform X1 [Anoplophora glabripennis]|uniref:ubiquitin thioesterase trabid isoform X1 n=1 Tax=Anoplophora glabripennis TaxID=217634 RepID=UPI000874B8AD|nr:ubiquitin thioesterase trabid isoform X1 [Anoplophora glabripennis]XP_018579146.1 ubiquitin thioesterase trabid isoform X1 [Anoplophora glabripennis]XP_018579147.1 ubiquitin thioesterase trabid isoform X1 [Anoplophora glabripennis]XP_018579148.1 ubiquitin thioesterase trabid isoform X1 [Anoplophora glabripennis]